ncbi:MAG: DNA/RNA non-specific endonuclease [Alistipes sp.]|jgi:endonuclease G|nr:DNA/RNA non-specific endonuclease [Alistipes sp.]
MNIAGNIRKLVVTVGLFVLIPLCLCGQGLEYRPVVNGVLIENPHYCLDFNTGHKQPNWVCYSLTPAHVTGRAPRSSTFRNGRRGNVSSATTDDYKGSGYDRGHLCPAADMKLSREAMTATFLMWNMSPQEPSFNRGGWAQLEALVRGYIDGATDTLHVVTGPVFIGNKGSIGANSVTIPGFFYKVIYCPRRGGIAFLMPNRRISGPLKSWQVSIDLIEALSGMDFFPGLPDERENEIEAQVEWWE